MALPFIAGLIIGGSAIYAFNNRAKIAKKIPDGELKRNLKKGADTIAKVSKTLKNEASSLTQTLATGAKRRLASVQKDIDSTAKTSVKKTTGKRGARKPVAGKKAGAIKRTRRVKTTSVENIQTTPVNSAVNSAISSPVAAENPALDSIATPTINTNPITPVNPAIDGVTE